MRKGYFLLFIGFVLLGGAIFWGGNIIAALPKKNVVAALQVTTIPPARVFLDGKDLGKSPLENDQLAPGEYTLRLVQENNGSIVERKVKLYPRVLTSVNYLFGPTEKESVGEILTLEKTNEKKGEIMVLSDPDGASFSIDGEDQGTAPKVLGGYESGDHELRFSFPGYQERTLTIRTAAGYKLLINVKLAGTVQEVPKIASESAVLKVKILKTPTGWLRVRTEPSVAASEAAKIKPNEEYPLLEEQEDWFKIQYNEDGEEKEGWISSQYGQKINGL
ncbi:PEGA domain-containing protein [Candidatus Microgenomates bacterium]|nr:PEGA domain-containing protein [Candidatus Microgenomates bacterium]